MLRFLKSSIFLFLVYNSLNAVQIDTFYGAVDIEEPVLIELIESPAFQRLKHIHQYGVSYYTTHREDFTRYEHSLGVFFLLRWQGCSTEEQIAGLLHDASHTIFSHVGDWIFNMENQETDYQTLMHADYLENSGLGTILRKYNYSIQDVMPKQELFPALEQPLPTLCADRLDYNLQGAFHQGFITQEEAVELAHEIQFIDGDWISGNHELLKKLVRFSIFMSHDCWGSGTGYLLSKWLAEAVLQGYAIGAVTIEDIRFGTDQEVWDRLLLLDDPLVQKNMYMILHSPAYHRFVVEDEADLIVRSKFRGIDPMVIVDGTRVHLTATDPELNNEFQSAKERMSRGWAIKLYPFESPLVDPELALCL